MTNMDGNLVYGYHYLMNTKKIRGILLFIFWKIAMHSFLKVFTKDNLLKK